MTHASAQGQLPSTWPPGQSPQQGLTELPLGSQPVLAMMNSAPPQRPLPQRPQALQMPNDVMEAMASARASGGQAVAAAAPALNLSALQSLAALGSLNRSAFAPVAPMLPEVGLWSQLNQMLVAGAAQQPGASELIAYQANLAAQQGAAARGNGRSRSGEGSKSSSAYANR